MKNNIDRNGYSSFSSIITYIYIINDNLNFLKLKKALKILGIIFLVFITLLIALPIAFNSQVNDMVKRFINDNLNAKVEFNDIDLSLLKNFPHASVSVNDLVITNLEPFKDQTLAKVNSISFSMPIKELFKNSNEDPIVVNSIHVNEALLILKTDKLGNNNYDITKETTKDLSEARTSSFSFNIKDYSINNSTLTFIDEVSKSTMHLSELNHYGNGTFSAGKSELDTKTNVMASFIVDSTNYMTNHSLKLNALIGVDLKNKKYIFKENKAFINGLPIEFSGFVQQLESGQDVDITFENPESSFKDFLAVIPKSYSKNLDNVQTSGDFKVKGVIKGLVSDKTIPHLDINIKSDNASFKYPDLPKRVDHISINTTVKNTTGNVDDTYIDVKALNFKIDEDVFRSSAVLKNLTKNMLVNASIDGVLNLANIDKVYPVELENTLSGIFKGKINASFDMQAIETNAYQRIRNSGSANITDFVFSSKDIVNPIHIYKADVIFKPETISLNSFKAQTGSSDLSAQGTIKNLLGFLLSNNTLQGNFNVNSNLFKVSDFMTEDDNVAENNKTANDSESLKIPSFLDCTINANAKTVVYDNLNLKDVTGVLLINDQQVIIKRMTSNIFDGALSISGNVSTKNEKPSFNLKLGADGFDIAQSFNNMALLQNLAPVAKLFQGKLNSSISLSGDLDKTFSPNLSSVSGNALAELLTTKINANQGELFNSLEGALGFIDFDKLDLKEVKTKLEFANGQVSLQPFQINYEDITIDVSGSHSFDKTLSYSAIFNVPAKYLGSDINQLIGKIDSEEAKNISIPVIANITGTYTSPTVTTDLTSAVSNLTDQLIEIKKQKLLNQGKGKVKDLIGDVIGSNKSKTDSIKKEQNNAINDVFNDIIGSKKTETDSSSNSNNTIKNALGGLFRKKKEKDTVN